MSAGATGWLPPLVLLTEFGGDWHRYLDEIYQYFWQDFIDTKPNLGAKRFALKRHPLLEGKEATFWHLISSGAHEDERLPDLRRCERIRWPRAMIEAVGSNQVHWWRNERQGESRVVISLPDFSYVTIVADRGDYALLWTAYCVEQDHRQRKLRREYEEYVTSGDADRLTPPW
jgi:hypothetical protein